MKKDDLIKVMQIAISLLDKGEANKANGVLKIALTEEFNSINWFDLDDELKNTIMSFPTRPVKFDVDLMSIEDLSGEQQFYLFYSDGNIYLVDTQGYTYPRYIVELKGFNSEDDKYELMEGLLRISDDIIIENAIKSIVIDFSKEEFDKDDVETFLQMRIEFLIKKAIASNLNLFQ